MDIIPDSKETDPMTASERVILIPSHQSLSTNHMSVAKVIQCTP